jgi:ribonuclease HIII
MKHILNDMSEQEKNSIREQHTGGMKVMTENFSKLINSKLGDSKPLVNEQQSGIFDAVWNGIKGGVTGVAGPLYNYLVPDVTKQTLKVLLDFTPAGVIRNMAKAAANGDANSFTKAFNDAQKYSKQDLSKLKDIAFKDLKTFGKILNSSGL